MLVLGQLAKDVDEGKLKARGAISSGAALKTFRKLVVAQNGDPDFVDHPQRLKVASSPQVIRSDRDGYIKKMDAKLIGEASLLLGAGRLTKGILSTIE